MEREEALGLLERMDDLQHEAMDESNEHRGANGEPTTKSMYYLGKDVAFAQAKEAIRARVEDSE